MRRTARSPAGRVLHAGTEALFAALDVGSRLLLYAGLLALAGFFVLLLLVWLVPRSGGGAYERARWRCVPLEVRGRAYFVPLDGHVTRVLDLKGGSGEFVCEVLDGSLPPGMELRCEPGSAWVEGSAQGWGWYEARIRVTDTGCSPFQSRTVRVRFRVGA